jgi:phage-related minor tail protein
MSKGYTLGEAIAIAMGQGAQIIGRSPTQLNAISGGNFRAAGGPVTAGGAYVVGERGPELFTPGVSGTISPTAPGAGGVAVAMTVNYPIMNDPAALDQLARLVGQAVMARVTRPGTLV